jgi:hypothetical protein
VSDEVVEIGQTKVEDHDVSSLGNANVPDFEVPMNDIVLVAIFQLSANLSGKLPRGDGHG